MNDEQLNQQLKQEFAKQKSQNRLTKAQLAQFKTACKKPKNNAIWPNIQWMCASIGAVFLAYLLFTQSQSTMQPLYTLNLNNYQQIEVHSIENGQYHLSFTSQKQQLDQAMVQAAQIIKNAYQGHGRLIEKQTGKWFIADCKQQTLLEINTELVAKLIDKHKVKTQAVGTLLTFKRNPQGQLISLSALEAHSTEQCG
ncbi:hypothetical protein PSECIP111951_00955 [Pseudoalteromonas holothuriae]|uniref:Uncharacterized protein n=1 Tax=Pseudoalteromonas holothuriae TaxID=2963714 RepID=A0A9W4QZ38_9GAMM|nr:MULTISPECIES: hypothetical protein [unclassified Pseudoalteromonas]CAH9054082.1 hypothetical protein PSECIP111951_00955 [Pseudoalteromonas sp. CIP111951]CAH9059110.1 hypothetical protein PSECIP111854_02335 [Pseudoalteromonas sp. CIP111854]